MRWKAGDAFVLPATVDPVTHIADPVTRTSDDSSDGCDNGAALYWINDAPLLRYLGVAPSEPKFPPAFYKLEVRRFPVQPPNIVPLSVYI